MIDFAELWDKGLTSRSSWRRARNSEGLWEGLHRIAVVPDWALAAVPPGAKRKLLVIAEDWCGDASSTIPSSHGSPKRCRARAADHPAGRASGGHGSLSDQRLALDPHRDRAGRVFSELGHWGPRPSVLQSWVMANRPTIPKAELYPTGAKLVRA